MKLRCEQWMNVRAALQALDVPYEKVIEEGRSKKIMNARFEFTRSFRMKLGGILHSIERVATDVQKQSDDMLKKYGGAIGDEFRILPEHWQEWKDEQRNLFDAEIDLAVDEIDESDLKLDANPIPVSVLSALMPIMASIEDQRESGLQQ